MSLIITESWIIERVNLDHDNLDDVKSLALPGSYHEKITGLGYSLLNFSRLQQLDLSKNNLSSLKGLEHLSLLEQLNLYYNKIQDLKEIFRLRKNQNLRDIDLRLNPVTGNEPDYRLFIAHMLPLLRRLDDRPVRDSERKAALMHFSSGDVPTMFSLEDDDDVEQKTVKSASQHPRVAHVKSIVQKPSVVQDDDTIVDVIDYVNKGKEAAALKLSKPSTQMHSKEDLVRIVRKQANEEERKLRLENEKRFIEREGNDGNLKFKDEDTAYSQYQSIANFTPHPGSRELPPTVNHNSRPPHSSPGTRQKATIMSSDDEFRDLPERPKQKFGEATTSQEVNRRKNLTQIKFVESILDLVDRYWNGSKSLHYHQKFQSLIYKPLEKYEKDLSAAREVQIKVLHDKLEAQQQENNELKYQLEQAAKESGDSCKSKDVIHTKRELESTMSRLQMSMNDNKTLRNKVIDLERQLAAKEDKKDHQAQIDAERVEELEHQKKDLLSQVAALKRSSEQYEKISQIATMLQDSHRSLVSTNEHLLSELEDTRCRHQSEIEQLKWSYDQLRSTSKLTNGHISNGEF